MPTRYDPSTSVFYRTAADTVKSFRAGGHLRPETAVRRARAKGATGRVQVVHESDGRGSFGLGPRVCDGVIICDERGATRVDRGQSGIVI